MRTTWDRVAHILITAGAVALVAIDQFGPGFGLTPAQIATAAVVINGIVAIVRQITDPTTPTLPPSTGSGA